MKLVRILLLFSVMFLLVSCAATVDGLKNSLANYVEPQGGYIARLRVVGKSVYFNGGSAVAIYSNTPCLPSRVKNGDGGVFSTGISLLSPTNGAKKIADESVIPKGYKYTEVDIVAGKPITLYLLLKETGQAEAYTFFPIEGRTYVFDSTAGFMFSPRLEIVGAKGEMVGYSKTGACAN